MARAADAVATQEPTYHDGRFATLRDVVDHYDTLSMLDLTQQEKGELIEYPKSL